MTVYNISGTNISGVVVRWLDGSQAVASLPSGGSLFCDGFQFGSNSSWVLDDGSHEYTVTIDQTGSEVLHSSWQPSIVLVDGFWWGMLLSTLAIVLWAVRKGFKAGIAIDS